MTDNETKRRKNILQTALSHLTLHLLGEPRGHEGHLECVGERVEGVEGLGVHGPHQGVSPSLELKLEKWR